MQAPTSPQDLPLRDIHLPDPISWWPPAPGWWVVVAACLVTVFFIVRWLMQRHRRLGVYRSASQALEDIRIDYQNHGDSKRLAQDLSELLRRIAISISSRNTAAGLTGEEWLNYLDSIIDGIYFNTEAGRVLIEAPYKPATEVDGDALLALCMTWIKNLSKGKSHA